MVWMINCLWAAGVWMICMGLAAWLSPRFLEQIAAVLLAQADAVRQYRRAFELSREHYAKQVIQD
jgi:hypothetical protein